jgi:hypothetical protein
MSWARLCRPGEPSLRSQFILVRPIALVASMTLSRAFRKDSQLPMMDSVRPCVSGFGGTGWISAASNMVMPRSSA